MTAMLRSLVGSDKTARRALLLSTLAFTVCFAVWTIFAVIGVRIKTELGLNETEFGLLAGTPILSGALVRLVLGIWVDRYGGRVVYTGTMLASAVATFLLVFAHTYGQMLVAALGIGVAGGSFAVGIAYVSRFFSAKRQGTALGIFGAGNVGAAITKSVAPFVLVAWGWHAVALIWAAALVAVAVIFWFTAVDDTQARDARRARTPTENFWQEFAPLKNLQVWRFALYYFFAFGAFVALALWLPHYLIGVYGFDIETAGLIATAYTIPASLFRAYGGVLSDRIGARPVMYWTFAVSAVATLILSLPPIVHNSDNALRFQSAAVNPTAFVGIIFVLGFFMSLGKAAVYKHIPTYYPHNVGAVGGLVGMIGGLGGFVLPIGFGALKDLTGLWSTCFMLLFTVVVVSFLWMHLSIRRMERKAAVSDRPLPYAAR